MPSSFTLTADVKLNPQSLNQSASQVKQALGRITGQASEFQKSLDASTARVFAFGATTVVLNSVSQAFRKLISSTIEVEKRIVEINAIFQQSERVINNFREAIFDVAQDTGQAFETVADAAGELARQGLTAEETATRLQAALILTRISGLGAEDSVKTLTAAINGFTSAALDAEEVTNKIVAVDTAFAVSAQDLAQGLARAGSTAEDAGVSFDQLLGLITAVEQRTARGGAVIGNAFKSIFTRLSRGSTIDDLQALGVEIDATQTGVQKLQALSTAIEGIGDPTVVSKIKELAGGVFQINVVSAALKDLTSETSVFKKATVEAANASNDAYKRNEELNKSLSAQINSLVQGITNLAAKIGTVTFGPLLTNLVSIAGKITEVFNNALDPEKGNSIVQGFIKGIGSFISGPGLVIITAAFLKIVKLVSKFAIDGFKAVLQIGSAAEKISQIEGGIVDLLSRDEKLRKIIASTTATQAQKEQAVINAIKQENQLLNEQKQLLTNIARIAAQRGVTGFNPSSGFSGGGRKRFAKGYVPNYARSGDFALEEREAISLGATKSVKAKRGKGTIGGKKFIMNNQETEIPNFGRNGDSAVIPSYARGYVPNYADVKPFFNSTRYVSYGKIKNSPPTALFTEKNSAKDYPFLNPSLKNTYNELVDGAGPLIRSKFTKWKNKQNQGSVNLKDDLKTPNPTILVPQGESGGVLTTSKNAGEGFKKIDFGFPIIGIKEKVKERLGKNFEAKFDPDEIEANAREDAVNQANAITKVLGDPPVKEAEIRDPEGFTGAIRAAAGAVFDAAVTKALQLKASKKGDGADFDVRVGGNENLKRLFSGDPTPNEGPLKGLGDFKYSSSAQKSMKAKTLKELRLKHKNIYDELRLEKAAKPKKNVLANDPSDPNPRNKPAEKKKPKTKGVTRVGKASGYIPNFAGRGPLGDAIKREKDAGLPMSKIRVEQSPRLANRDNPTGLAVTNTRDEPRGLRDVFASGYVPNFALAPNPAAAKVTEVNSAALQEEIDDATGEVRKTNKGFKSLGSSIGLLLAVSQISTAVESNYAEKRAKATKAEEDKLKASLKELEAKKKAIEGSNKTTQEKNRELESIKIQIAVAERDSEQTIELINSKRSLGESLASGSQRVFELAFSLSALSDIVGGDLFGKIKLFSGSLVKANTKFKNLALDKIKAGGSTLAKAWNGLAARVKAYKLPKLQNIQGGGKGGGQGGGSTIIPLGGGKVGKAAKAGKAGKVVGILTKVGKPLLRFGSLIGRAGAAFLGLLGPIGLIAGALYTLYEAFNFIGDKIGDSKVNEINKQGKADREKLVGKQADRAITNAPKEADLVAAIAKASAAGDKDKEATLKIQLEGVKDLKAAAEAYRAFGAEEITTTDAEGNSSLESSERAKKAQADFSSAKKRANPKFAEAVVTANKALASEKAKQLQVQVKIGKVLASQIINEGKIAAIQKKEALVRQNSIKDLSRAKSLLPKDVLEAGGGALVDFQTTREQVAQGKSNVFDRQTDVADRTREVKDLTQQIGDTEDGEAKNALQEKLEEAASGLSEANVALVEAQDQYSNVIKDGAAQTQTNLNEIADKIKNSGSKSLTEAFEKFEKIASSRNIDPSQYQSAAAEFFKTLNTEVKSQFASNAIAAGDFYGKVVKSLQNPEESAKDIDTVIAGLKAANDPKNTNQEKANIIAKISPKIEELKAKYGEESETFKAVLNQAGLTPDQYKKQQRDIVVGQINAQKNVPKEIKKAQIADLDRQAEEKEKYKPEKFKEQATETFKNFQLLQNQLNNYREAFPDADKILTASENLAKSLGSVGGVVDNFKTGLSGLTAFGENADKALQDSKKNLEGLADSSEGFASQLETLNKTEADIAAKLIKLQAAVEKLAGQGGEGGGAQ